MGRLDKFYVFLVIGLSVFIGIAIGTLVNRFDNNSGRGEVTVYGLMGEIDHFDDAKWRRANDMVIVKDGDREVKYINCNVEVKE